MGPLRFERRSEDPQSPRMARLPYGPPTNLVQMPYVPSLIEARLLYFQPFEGFHVAGKGFQLNVREVHPAG